MTRVLAFVLLLVAGFVALRLAIGDEPAASVDAAPRAPLPATPDPASPPAGVRVQHGGHGAGMTQSGAITIPRRRSVPLADGSERREDVFVLTAAGSRPLATGVQQLDDLTVVLFDRGEPAATLAAAQAFVVLQTDAGGAPALDEGKDVDLRDVVLTGMPGGRLDGLRLELATAKVRVDDDKVLLTTPPEQPVRLALDGRRRVELRGRGTQALFARDRAGDLRRADVEILQQPEIESDGLTVRARGRLRYVEDLATGAAQLLLDDDVEADVAAASLVLPGAAPAPRAADGAPAVRIRGDQFVGHLSRTPNRRSHASGGDSGARAAADAPLQWQQLVLTGAPATITTPDGLLRTPKLTIVPGLTGEPALFAAHGGESTFEQTEVRPGAAPGERMTATTRRRLLLWRPGAEVGAMHRSLGFPRWSLRQFEDLPVVLVEGGTELRSDTRTLSASDGIRVYRRTGSDAGVVHGLGTVRIEQRARDAGEQDLVATGSDGFVWTTTAEHEVLRLGPPLPTDLQAPGRWREHECDVRYGSARARGRGVAQVERTATGSRVEFVSPDGTMDATVPQQGLTLQRVRRLVASQTGAESTTLDVAGWPLAVTMQRGGELVRAEAPRLLQIGPRSLRLLPPDEAGPAALWAQLPASQRLPLLRQVVSPAPGRHGHEVDVRGPAIDVHHAGGRLAIVDAHAAGGERPQLYARAGNAGGAEPTTIACTAERLRVLPFVLTPEAQLWHTRGTDPAGALATTTFHTLGRGWLLVDDVREFELDDPVHGHVEGHGRQLVVSQGARAALFAGDADAQTPAEVVHTRNGRVTTLRGARVRVDGDGADVRLDAFGTFADRSTFLPPSLALHGGERSGLFSHMQASSRGTIEVRPESVEFRGPVVASSLRTDGSIDPAGLHVDARRLRLERAADSGDVVRVVANDVVADWQHVHAVSETITIDRRTRRLVAEDPDDAVVTVLGGPIRSPRIEIDYATWAVRVARGRAAAAPLPPPDGREVAK